MFQLIKWAFFAVSVSAIVTADDKHKEAMWRGAQAFGEALVTACTRDDGPCLSAAKAGTERIAQIWDSAGNKFSQGIEPGAASSPPQQEAPQRETRDRAW